MSKGDSAQEKTLDPTPRKIEKAYEDGKIGFSIELVHWFFLIGMLIFLWFVLPFLCGQCLNYLSVIIQTTNQSFDRQLLLIHQTGIKFLLLVCGSLSTLLFFGIFGNLIQTYKSMRLTNIKVDLARLSWAQGVKKLCSVQTLVNAIKTIGKFIILSIALYLCFDSVFDQAFQWIFLDERITLHILAQIVSRFLWSVLIVFTVISMMDFAYQRYQFWKNLRMGLQELKDEMKDNEISNLVRQRMRQLRDQAHRQNLNKSIPEATVIVVNPTHIAVALRWDEKTMKAPIVTAKGRDFNAQKIRELARRHQIPIIHNPKIARGLYEDIVINLPITPAYYQAIAQIMQKIMDIPNDGNKSNRNNS